LQFEVPAIILGILREEVDIDESHAVFERGLMTIKLPTEVLEGHNALASRGLSVRPNPSWRKPVYGMGFSPGRLLTREEVAKRRAKARKKRRKP